MGWCGQRYTCAMDEYATDVGMHGEVRSTRPTRAESLVQAARWSNYFVAAYNVFGVEIRSHV